MKLSKKRIDEGEVNEYIFKKRREKNKRIDQYMNRKGAYSKR